jgi:c-di-GMP-binding flagellar brake protein YcgR
MSHQTNSEGPPEKREHFRIDTVLPVTYCVEGEPVQPLPQPVRMNLSVGGLGLVADRPLKVGDALSLTLLLPSGGPIRTQAKVIRDIPASHDLPVARIGVKFTSMEERDRERLNRHIFALQLEQRRARYL